MRTGEVTFYNFTQFYVSSLIKIGKKQYKTKHKKNPQNISAVPEKMVARNQYIQGQNQGKAWQAERVRNVTQTLLLGMLTHKQVAEVWGCRMSFWDTTDPLLLCCWINDKNLTVFWVELIAILSGCKWKRQKEENKGVIFTLKCRQCWAGFLWSTWVCSWSWVFLIRVVG